MICLYIDPNTEATISTHEPKTTEWFGNGTCILLPSECKVTEKANAAYSLHMVHPITDDERWKELKVGRVIRANVPVRDNPEGQVDETTTRNVYAINAGKKSTILYKTETGSGKIKTCKKGTRFIAIDETGENRYYVMLENGGKTGWVQINDLVLDGTVTETPAESGKESSPNGVIRELSGEQFFRIQSVEVNSYDKTVEVDAMHIFYDASYMTMPFVDEKFVGATNTLIANMNRTAGFLTRKYRYFSTNRREAVHLVTDVEDDIVIDTSGRTYTDLLLNETDGIVTKIGGRIIRDNYEAYILPMVVRDLGYTIKYAKNLQGITMSTDISSVVTRIVSTYKNKKGEYEYSRYVKSSDKIYQYPVIYEKCIDYGLQVGKDGLTTAAQVEAKLDSLMAQEFTRDKVDEPTISATIDFTDLGATEEYAQYKALNALHIFDTVTITDNEILEDPISVRVVGYVWDCLTESYDSIELGDIKANNRSLTGYSLSRIASNIRTNAVDVTASQAAADEAQETATEKAKVTSASSAPSSPAQGDYWIDTANGNVIKEYDGSSWVLLQDANVATSVYQAALNDAKASQEKAAFSDASAIESYANSSGGTTGRNILYNGAMNGNPNYGLAIQRTVTLEKIYTDTSHLTFRDYSASVEMAANSVTPACAKLKITLKKLKEYAASGNVVGAVHPILGFRMCEELIEGHKYRIGFNGKIESTDSSTMAHMFVGFIVGDVFRPPWADVSVGGDYITFNDTSYVSQGTFTAMAASVETSKTNPYIYVGVQHILSNLDDYGDNTVFTIHSVMLIDVTSDSTFPSTFSDCKAQTYSNDTVKTKLDSNGFKVSGFNADGTAKASATINGGALTSSNGVAAGANKTVTLAAADWDSSLLTQSVTISGLSASANLIVSPVEASRSAWISCGVRGSAQGAGTITFACDSVPSNDLTVNVLMLGGVVAL